MSDMTRYLQKALLDHLLDLTPYTAPASIWLSLHTDDPGENGSHADEISTSGTGYARVTITGSMGGTDLATGQAVNTLLVTLGPATADWGTILALGIDDAGSAGSMLLKTTPSVAKTIVNGDTYRLTVSQLSIRFL